MGGAPVNEGGGDGGAGGADAGAGEGGSGAADAGGEGGDSSESGLLSTGDGGDDAGAADPDAPVDLGDGRTVPAKWKNLFEAAKAQGLDKEVRQLFFGNQRLAAKFPGGINEAVQLADKVE